MAPVDTKAAKDELIRILNSRGGRMDRKQALAKLKKAGLLPRYGKPMSAVFDAAGVTLEESELVLNAQLVHITHRVLPIPKAPKSGTVLIVKSTEVKMKPGAVIAERPAKPVEILPDGTAVAGSMKWLLVAVGSIVIVASAAALLLPNIHLPL